MSDIVDIFRILNYRHYWILQTPILTHSLSIPFYNVFSFKIYFQKQELYFKNNYRLIFCVYDTGKLKPQKTLQFSFLVFWLYRAFSIMRLSLKVFKLKISAYIDEYKIKLTRIQLCLLLRRLQLVHVCLMNNNYGHNWSANNHVGVIHTVSAAQGE